MSRKVEDTLIFQILSVENRSKPSATTVELMGFVKGLDPSYSLRLI